MKNLKREWESWAAPALLLGLWALFHYRAIFLGQTFVLMDSSRFFYPLWKWGAHVWSQGSIPLWNPDAGFGMPYLADPQMALWYPPLRVLYQFLSPATAFTWLILSHHLWALFGFWVFARSRGFSFWLSLGGSLLFGFSFNAISLFWATPMLFAYSWIPWVFHSAYQVRDGKRWAFFFLSLGLSMQLASGYPLFSYLTFLALGLDWATRRMGERRRAGSGWIRSGMNFAAAALLAILYNAAWIIPFGEFAPFSNLSARTEFSSSLGWTDLVTWVNPFFKGHPLHSYPETPFSVTVFFTGLPTLVVLLWGAWKGKLKWPSTAFFLLVLGLSLGETAGLGGWLKNIIPFYGLVVRSGYWIPFVVWGAARLFLEAGDEAGKESLSFWDARWMMSMALVLALALLAGAPWDLLSFWVSFFFVVLAGLGKTLSRDWRQAFLALSLIFSLGPAVRSINFTMDKDYYEAKPVLAEALSQPGRVHHSITVVDRFRTVSGSSVSDVYGKLKEALVPNWPLVFEKEEVGEENALFLKSTLWWAAGAEAEAKKGNGGPEDYLGIRYSVQESRKGWTRLSASGKPLEAWENKRAFPKWYSVERGIVDWTGWNRAESNFSIDFKKQCYATGLVPQENFPLRKVMEESRETSHLQLSAEGRGRALLVSSETAYPGWRAFTGALEIPVVEVNHGFRGVFLEEGQEEVRLAYRPTTFKLGCFLSLLVCSFWAFGWLSWRGPLWSKI